MDVIEPDPDGRHEIHNAAFDEVMVTAHLCGMTDLRTGRTCIEPAHHSGSCLFVVKEAARIHSGAMPTEERRA